MPNLLRIVFYCWCFVALAQTSFHSQNKALQQQSLSFSFSSIMFQTPLTPSSCLSLCAPHMKLKEAHYDFRFSLIQMCPEVFVAVWCLSPDLFQYTPPAGDPRTVILQTSQRLTHLKKSSNNVGHFSGTINMHSGRRRANLNSL